MGTIRVWYKDLKTELADIIIAFTTPIIARYKTITDQEVLDLLKKWAEMVRPLAEQKIRDVYAKVWFSL